ncbi:TetR/AcrR family transcriptional regulator [Planomonospora sp. ID91781]|uniref:TetR family transcriptional regulator n=2 Tax=Planomonospora parontospora TaxID=58119 RepID=A0AA37BMM8_9ACTN|nr:MULTISPECIES: TetR/AcrR family transcriptional regulator [Planomonospora]MBG0822629.1 TetR/AcrR family transcriptional regulator [Planomonospora sp. ID91781]GGK93361.1 TetR family transcriptional regulator [Planomonospora parontospora]GII12266.1 HTH-type transcriptional repressor KstR2 [Planomonospora parontospora subsp. parontospora]
MSPRRRDSESTATARAGRRAELLATAAEVFASRGYAATTVREVADAAGILGGSLYYHFDSKESMVDEILSTFLTDMWASYDRITAAGLGARETFHQLVAESFRMIDLYRPAVMIYQNESRHLAASPRFSYLLDSMRRFREMWLSVLDRGVLDGEFRADLDTGLIYRFIRDTVWVAASWYRSDGPLSADEIARQYIVMVLEGILET